MYYDRVTKTEQVTRLASGEVQCGDNHRAPYSYRDTIRPAAVAVVYDTGYSPEGYLAFVCRRHLGTVRSNISKGSWSFRDAEVLDIPVAEAAADVEGTLKAIVARHKAEKAERERISAERDLAYRREGWDRYREQYLVDAKIKDFSLTSPDEFGRVNIVGNGMHVTPQQARAIIAALTPLIDKAEAIFFEQVKP